VKRYSATSIGEFRALVLMSVMVERNMEVIAKLKAVDSSMKTQCKKEDPSIAQILFGGYHFFQIQDLIPAHL
jgi:hypothetical protein